MSLWLNDDELAELTGYKRRELQKGALGQLKIKFRSRPSDGFPLVERAQFEGRVEAKTRPNFAAVEA